jgi:hypothetical protein
MIVVLLTAVAWRFCHRESKTQQQQGQGTGTTSDPEFDALVLTPSAPPADTARPPEGIPMAQGSNADCRNAQIVAKAGPSAPPAKLVQAAMAKQQEAAAAVVAVASTPSARDGAVPAEIDGDFLPERNPPTSSPNNGDGRQLSEYIAELARKQEALAEQQAELSRRQGDLQQELEEARRRQRHADTETETELEAESPESPGSSPDEFKVVARAVLYL